MFLFIRRAETLPKMSGKMIADIFCATFQVTPADLAHKSQHRNSFGHKLRVKILLGTTCTLRY